MPDLTTRRKGKSATTVFLDERYKNLAVQWKVGSSKLSLVRKGGADGGAIVLMDTHIPGAKTDWESAQAEADKWFDALPFDFEEDEVDVDVEDQEEDPRA